MRIHKLGNFKLKLQPQLYYLSLENIPLQPLILVFFSSRIDNFSENNWHFISYMDDYVSAFD